MSYDHGDKAGNEGDVVKHVALYAALDTILAGWSDPAFRFADLYAGYATNILPVKGAWNRGIEVVANALRARSSAQAVFNGHVCAWADRYLGDPVGPGDCYPGSSLLARDLVLHHGKRLRMAVWDVSPGPLGNLWSMFGSGANPMSPSKVYTRPATLSDSDLQAADFVFLDPPEVKGFWLACFDVIAHLRGKHFLLWLPIMAGRAWSDSDENRQAHAEALRLNLGSSRIVWAERRQGIVGCELIYPFPQGQLRSAMRDAIDDVVRLAGWSATMSTVSAGAPVTIGPTTPVFHTP